MNFIIKGEDGKPVFIGKEDSNNPPPKPRQGAKMECPQCHDQVDYLLGENTPDGGKQGCEKDYKAGKIEKGGETYDKDREII